MKRIGILTGGGDAPGLNAVIRAVVKSAIHHGEYEVLGIRDGFEGCLSPEGVVELTRAEIRGILPRGGTILGAANRGNPFARQVVRDGKEVIEDVSNQVERRITELGLETLIVVGGDGTLRISLELYRKGMPIVGVPKTIDNDIHGTEVTFGFDTAVNTAMEAIDRLHTTAESHHRVIVLELMGRDAGFIALQAGIAGGADVILIPEIPFEYERICETIRAGAEHGRRYSIIVAAEGARPKGGQQVFRQAGGVMAAARLGGIGQVVAQQVEGMCRVESRVMVLGHLQRGGSPTAFDRWLATRFGAAAFLLALEKKHGRMVALRGAHVVDVPLAEALVASKRVDLNGDGVRTARTLGLCLGD